MGSMLGKTNSILFIDDEEEEQTTAVLDEELKDLKEKYRKEVELHEIQSK